MSLDPETDPLRPPNVAVEVHCIHCGITYTSDRMVWKVVETERGPEGFWFCGMDGCDGMGFGMDVHPLDNYIDPESGMECGWFNDDGTPGSLREILRREAEESAARGDDDDHPLNANDIPF